MGPGPLCEDEDAKVDLLLLHTRLFSIPPALPPAFRSRPDCTLGIGLPCGVTLRRLSEFLRRVPSAPRSACASRFNLRLRLFASTAPDTCRGSDLFQQGGCQQANLLAREAFASVSNLCVAEIMSTVSIATMPVAITHAQRTDRLADKLQVDSQIRAAHPIRICARSEFRDHRAPARWQRGRRRIARSRATSAQPSRHRRQSPVRVSCSRPRVGKPGP